METALELMHSRIEGLEHEGGGLRLYFSQAYVHKSAGRPGYDPGSLWSYPAELYFPQAHMQQPIPPLPATISEGYLEVGKTRYEYIPLPLQRQLHVRLYLQLIGAGELELQGELPMIELFGSGVYLESQSLSEP